MFLIDVAPEVEFLVNFTGSRISAMEKEVTALSGIFLVSWCMLKAVSVSESPVLSGGLAHLFSFYTHQHTTLTLVKLTFLKGTQRQ